MSDLDRLYKAIENNDQNVLKEVKVKTSLQIDGDVLDELKKRAQENGFDKYQPYLRLLLRHILFDEQSPNVDEVITLKKVYEELEELKIMVEKKAL